MSKQIIVAGLGRCGTSLVMDMLSKADILTVGEHPDYEDFPENIDWQNLPPLSAIKSLGEDVVKIPGDSHKIVWLQRNAKQQAKSSVKMLQAAGFSSIRMNDEYISSFKRDNKRIPHLLKSKGTVRVFNFEDIIERTSVFVTQLCDYLEIKKEYMQSMNDVVLPRSSECQKDMTIENALVGWK